MFEQARSLLRRSWPFVGSLYLGYLAIQSPPVRYVGLVGLAVVTPLLVGWVAGNVFGVGPWATESTEDDQLPAEGESPAEEEEDPVNGGNTVDEESSGDRDDPAGSERRDDPAGSECRDDPADGERPAEGEGLENDRA